VQKYPFVQLDRANLQGMSWDDLRVFLAIHRAGSHARAARVLGVDATTIGRRVAALETAVRTRLFDRTPDGRALTPAGIALLARAERIEAEMLAAERELQGLDAELTGTVRLTAGDGLLQYILLPAVGALRARHAGLDLELRGDTRNLDLSRREADLAVRLGRPTEPALVARRLGEVSFGLFASPRYLERRTAPRGARALAGHDFIGFEAALDALPQVRWLRRMVPNARYAIRANTTALQAAACAHGLGIALLPGYVAAYHPELVTLLPRLAAPVRECWVVAHQDVRRNARVAVVMEWLGRLFAGA